ncbi:MAG TPA: aa3-type cytochrome c oxidase subunit IV [Rhizomicrobium sp.]|nr:aa3-type cytochrome c oxidase subunit IV [Rhizomicrobium sp.]
MESEHGHAPDSGTTDMTEHLKTWHGFLAFMKWQVVAIVILLVFLAIFRTHG